MPEIRLKQFLEKHKVSYSVITHSPAFTAQGVAAAAHIKGRDFAKTVMIKFKGNLAMAVLPAHLKLDFNLLKQCLHSEDVALATERDFERQFPGCEVGAMPPFGNLYGMDVFVTKDLTKDERIAFNAGSHSELIQMSYKDFSRLVHPKVLEISAQKP